MGQPAETRVAIAAMNNAWWCRSVCAAHGDPGVMGSKLWEHPATSPPFYPNAITLTADPALSGAIGGVFERANAQAGEPWSVKDSFATLDLAPLGFRVLFSAEWLCREPRMAVPIVAGWSRVTTPGELAEWEAAWNDGEPLDMPIFRHGLLSDEDVEIWARREEQEAPISAGGVISRSPGAVGLSNTFARGPADIASAVESLASLAGQFAPGLPVVGYESAEDCPPYLAAGFERAGPLRVWIKD